MGPDIEDQLIDAAAKKLREVYDNQTAGDYTFEGILSAFLRQIDKARTPKKVMR